MILIDILTHLEYGEDNMYFTLFGVDIHCTLVKRNDYRYKFFKLFKKDSNRTLYLYVCSFTSDEVIIDSFGNQDELGRYKITDLKEDPTYFILRDSFLREDVSVSS